MKKISFYAMACVLGLAWIFGTVLIVEHLLPEDSPIRTLICFASGLIYGIGFNVVSKKNES
jgi:hypothetical protein